MTHVHIVDALSYTEHWLNWSRFPAMTPSWNIRANVT
jgi:hypothetical protein